MKRTLFAAVLLLCLTGCLTDENGAKRVLEDQGYKDIQMTGYDYWLCGDDYTFATGFKATSIANKPVEGAVCSGVLKGYSIKLK